MRNEPILHSLAQKTHFMSCHVGLDCMALIFVKRTCLKAAAIPFKAKPHSLSMLKVRRKSEIKLKGDNVFDGPYFRTTTK